MTNKQVNDLLSGDIPGTARHTIKQQQAEIARLQAEIIQLRGKYNRLCEANSLDDVVWGKTWIEMEEQQTEITQLKAKLELCRESFIECRVCSMMPGEVEKITTEALAAIERRDGE